MLAVSEQSHPSRVDGLYRTDRVPFDAGDLNHSAHGSDQDGACNEPSPELEAELAESKGQPASKDSGSLP